MKLLRCFESMFTAAVWGFLIAGALGLTEGCYQWLRFDVAAGQETAHGVWRQLLSALTFSGWAGLCGTIVLYLPISVLAWARGWTRAKLQGVAVAGMLASLVTVFADYVIYEHLGWWDDLAPSRWSWLVLTVAWGCFVSGFSWLIRKPALAVARLPRSHLIFPALLIIVTTSLWPDWRAEGLQARMGHLERRTNLSPAADAPKLVLISVDTWRYDRLSVLYPNAPPTPALDAFAADAIVYENVWSTSPWTLPAMTTLFTGLPPYTLQQDLRTPMPRTVPTLGEVAWCEAYRTAAFCTNAFMTSYFGFDRGFEFYEHATVLETLLPVPRAVLARQTTRAYLRHFEPDGAETVIPKATAWLSQWGMRGPFCLWIHLVDPHLPYIWKELPSDPARPAASAGVAPTLDGIPQRAYFAHRRFEGLAPAHLKLANVDDAARLGMLTLYDREVQNADYWIGVLLRDLQRLGHYDDSVIMIVADHGEEFFEYGGYEHGHTLMPPVTRVPLLLKLPQSVGAGLRVTTPVTSLDLLPTLAAAMKWSLPDWIPGRPLWPVGTDSSATPVLITENLLYGPQGRAFVDWPWMRIDQMEEEGCQWFRLMSAGEAIEAEPSAETKEFVSVQADSTLAAWSVLAERFGLHGVGQEVTALPAALRRELQALGY